MTTDAAAAPPGWRRPVRLLVEAATVAAELALVGMLALTVLEIGLRSLAGLSLQFADEVAGYLLVALTFLGLGIAVHDRALFRVEFLFRHLPDRGRAAVELLFNVAGLVFACLLQWQLVRQTLSTFNQQMVAPSLLATPLWIPQFAMPVGGALLIVVMAAEVADDGLRLAGRRPVRERPR